MRVFQPFTLIAIAIAVTASPAKAQDDSGISADVLKGRPYSPYADRGYPTEVYFGDLHVHTSLSADAGGSGTRLGPRDAYRFAHGEQIVSNSGQPVKLARAKIPLKTQDRAYTSPIWYTP